MKILEVCTIASDVPGNFISSMVELEKKLKKMGHEVIYAFPIMAKDKDWCKEIEKRTKVYYLPLAKAIILPQTYSIFKKIYKKENIDIVHSHYELYDIPATLMAPKNVKIFWHLHDSYIGNNRDFVHKLIEKLQYKYFSKRAFLISVNEEYRKKAIDIGFLSKNTITLDNGLVLSRIIKNVPNSIKKYDFMTLGSDYYTKGVDIILDVCERLNKENYKFKFLLNGNDKTWVNIKNRYANNLPDWLVMSGPVLDVNKLYLESRIFIQASRNETFSCGVCEAIYSGMEVICSKIPGLKWSENFENVRFFENENINQLYSLIKDSLKYINKINNEQIKYNRKNIEKKYSIDVWINKIIYLYFNN